MNGVDVNKFICGITPLMHAAKTNDIETLKQLLSHKEIEIDLVDEYECSALVYACNAGHHESVKILLEHGAKVCGQKIGYGYMINILLSLVWND